MKIFKRNLGTAPKALAFAFAGIALWSMSSQAAADTLLKDSTQTRPWSEESFIDLEREIFLAPASELDQLEHRIARLMQLSSTSHEVQYLMSSLLLRMYLVQPTDITYLKQSAMLAAQAYELNTRSELGVIALANILEASGEVQKGLDLLSELERKNVPLSWRFHFAKARFLGEEAPSAESMEHLKLALQDPKSIRSLVAPYAIAILGLSDAEAVRSQLEELNKVYPCIEFQLSLASIYLKDGDTKKALVLLQQLQKTHPNRAEPFILEASMVLSKSRDAFTARKLLKHASKLDVPEYLRSDFAMTLALSSLYEAKKSFDKKTLMEAVKLASQPEIAMLKISGALASEKRYPEILKFLSTVQTELPGIASSYGLEGEILLSQLKRPVEAANRFSDAIVLDNENSRYYNGRGLAYYQLKQMDLALVDFEYATRADPSSSSARYNLACVLALKGRGTEAIRILAGAIELEPSLLEKASHDKDFASLRSNVAFQNLLNDMKEIGNETVFAH